jgi:uncharacterized repeat protein (TIGR01451 family)
MSSHLPRQQASASFLQKEKRSNFYYHYRMAIILGIISHNVFWMPRVVAQTVLAGDAITNQATGSFVDSANGGSKNIESNIVSVTVAEVAGITITAASTPTAIVGSTTNFDFKIQNVGNDPTKFFLPQAPSSISVGSTASPLQIVGYIPAGGTQIVLATPITVTSTTGASTGDLSDPTLGGNTTIGSIPVGAAIVVRFAVSSTAAVGSTISVTLGNTTNQPNTSNTPYIVGANGLIGTSNDVYTIDNPNVTPGDPDGAPINGDRESSLIQTVTVSALAFIPIDFGDAPDTYGTLLGSPNSDMEGGARHQISSLYLGAGVSAEPNATLTGDSNDDGVIFSPLLTAPYQTIVQAGIENNIRITSNGPGFLNAWIDYNEDGDFSDLGEQVFTNRPIADGVNNLTFTPPNSVLHGNTYARFRLSPTSIATPSPTGLIVGGEVEDYRIDVTAPIPNDGSCTTTGLLNGSFEQPGINSTVVPRETFTPNIKAYFEVDVPGWNTNDLTEPVIEIWQDGALGVPSYEGNQFAELNAYGNFGLFQDIATIPGQTLRWQFAHRARVSVDTMQLNVGSPGGTLSSQGTYSTDSTGWILYQGSYQVPPGQYITRFQFDAISTGSGSIGSGNFLDAVKFSTNGCVPLVSPPTIDLDGDNSTAPGNNYLNRFVAGGAAVSAADSDVAIADDGVNISRAVIILTTRPDNASETLSIDLTAGGTVTGGTVTGTYNPANGRLSLSGNTTKANYQKIIATLKYNNSQATPTNGDRLIQVQVLDSDSAISNTAISKIVIGSQPNLLLVKRITAINNQSLNGYNQEEANPYDDNILEPSIAPSLPNYPTVDTTKWPGTTGKADSTFLVGVTSSNVKPKDSIEYTIYFLSAGDSAAKNVLFCDRVPENVTFIPTAFNAGTPNPDGLSTADRGIAIQRNGQVMSYTNIADGDDARYYPPLEPLPNGCKKTPTDPPLPNPNGAVVVNLKTIPNATTVGEAGTYGFVRFRGQVK